MKTIIHDLNNDEISKFSFNNDDCVVNSNACQNSCIGCFSCWIKHPKKCLYKDNFSNLTDKLKNSNELIIISKSRYGCYSTSIKRVLERCLGYVLPYFTIKEGMIHHIPRYKKDLFFKTYFYGDITEQEKKDLYNLVKANSINLNAHKFGINYFNNIEEMINCIH